MSGRQLTTGEGADGFRDAHDLGIGQLGKHREREDARGLTFGYGEAARAVAERTVSGLEVDGHRIVDAGLNIRRAQMFLQRIARDQLHNVEMIDVARVRRLSREHKRVAAALRIGQ